MKKKNVLKVLAVYTLKYKAGRDHFTGESTMQSKSTALIAENAMRLICENMANRIFKRHFGEGHRKLRQCSPS